MAVSISAQIPTKVTYILESERWSHLRKQTETDRIELSGDDTIKDALIKIGALNQAMSGECKLVFVQSFAPSA